MFAGYSYYIDAVVFHNNCNAGVALVYVVHSPSQADGNPWTYVPGALYSNVFVGSQWSVDLCEYPQGCTDSIAINYDSVAVQDDGSCTYASGTFLVGDTALGGIVAYLFQLLVDHFHQRSLFYLHLEFVCLYHPFLYV